MTITESFVNNWARKLMLLSQQMGSRLYNCVTIEPAFVGKATTVEQVSQTEMEDANERYGDTPISEQDHRRRWLICRDKHWGTMIEDFDRVKLLVQPDSKYMRNAMAALGRDRDARIISSFNASVLQGGMDSSLGSPIALPSAQTIAVNYVESGSATNTSLTIGKIRMAKELLDDADFGDDRRFAVTTGQQLHSLLTQTEVTSSDYQNVKALVHGDVNTLCGFTFKRVTPALLPVASNIRSTFFWHQDAVSYGQSLGVRRFIARDPGKKYNYRPYIQISHGAVRTEDDGVVEILCDETKLAA